MLPPNQKDTQLTFTIRLTLANHQPKDRIMIIRPVNKTICILQSGTHKTLYREGEVKIVDNESMVEEFVIGKKVGLVVISNGIESKAQAVVTGYCDQHTRRVFAKQSNNIETILFIIKPGFLLNSQFGSILTLIEKDFTITRFKMFTLTKTHLSKYLINDKMLSTQNDTKNIEYLSSGACFGVEVRGEKVLVRLRKLCGQENPIEAKKTQPLSLRAKYGTNIIHNCCYYSKSQKSAKEQLEFIFSSQVQQQPPLLRPTCCLCLIKPHIIQSKQLGSIITHLLQNGIKITSMRLVLLPPQLAKKYMDLYRFLPEYEENLRQLGEGRCVVVEVEVGGKGEGKEEKSSNTVEEFKRICGPYDPSYAKKICPDSVRAVFGVDRVRNAVHCTEIWEDAEAELRILFEC